MDTHKLIRLHMALECITVNDNGDMISILCPNPDDIHRLYITHHETGYDLYFRHDVPEKLRSALRRLSIERLFHEREHVRMVFNNSGVPCPGMHVGKSYIYPADYLPVIDPSIQRLPEDDLCTLTIGGAIAASCRSIRHNDDAAEAYVFTDDRYRQQGYGKRVVRPWAQRVRQSGRVPFYSHVIDNIASQRLAESLGFAWYIDDVGYE